ncbi:hydantoinase/oxoprolinase family protein [Reyranella sp.]|uniref:hydantoinase/oxoprolinase family protein n=1 Tax=Reyranella sp. TaxID=1929291 RepID=UPI003BAA4EB3
MPAAANRIGVDVGGTFTDLVVEQEGGVIEVFKVPSVPSDPSRGVLDAVAAAAAGLGTTVPDLLARCGWFVHGSTVATNTVLERKGARVGMLTTAGFRDSVEIRRSIRENPWDHRTPFAEPLVPRNLRLGVRGRLDAQGRELAPLLADDVRDAVARFAEKGVDSIAICFINAYADGRHEAAAAEIIREVAPQMSVSLSSRLAPIVGEYERGSTTVIDAYIRRRVIAYLEALGERLRDLGFRGEVALIQSNGGAIGLSRVARAPVGLCLSGPAAGIGAMRYFGRLCGSDDLITMEIGGTSCDVSMLQAGRAQLIDGFGIGGHHVGLPAIDIHTVGAGGGTIARVDEAGLLRCGPQGAGAAPGPAAYGRGGSDATTTDALVVLGRMRAGPIGDGSVVIDAARARAACAERVAGPLGLDVEEAAIGIVQLLEQNLLHAVEEISVKRGLNPARYTLIAAGGAGPMHGATVGRALGCTRVYVPRHAGAFCALGMLDSDIRHDLYRVFDAPLGDEALAALPDAFAELARTAIEEVGAEPSSSPATLRRVVDLVYKGQMRSVQVDFEPGQDDVASLKGRFEAEHRRLYGHIKPITPIRIAALRVVATVPASALAVPERADASGTPPVAETRRVFIDRSAGWADVPVYRGTDLGAGHALSGPLVIEEHTMTLYAGPGDHVSVDRAGNYVIDLR